MVGDKMLEKISLLIQNNTMIFPRALLLNYKKMNLTEKDTLFLICLINEKDLTFNPEKIAQDLTVDFEEVLQIIGELTNKDLIEIKMVKENNIHQEYLSLDKLYKKLALFIISDESENEEDHSDIYDTFEKEFGRTLSPKECEFIKSFVDEYGEELLMCALDEAIYHGVRNFRYIDNILATWHKSGIKNKADVEKNKRDFKKSKQETKKLFDWDYLNEDE